MDILKKNIWNSPLLRSKAKKEVGLAEMFFGYFIGQFHNLKALDLLPYHTMGEKKYDSLGMEYRLKGVPPMDKTKLIEKKKAVVEGIKKRRAEESPGPA